MIANSFQSLRVKEYRTVSFLILHSRTNAQNFQEFRHFLFESLLTRVLFDDQISLLLLAGNKIRPKGVHHRLASRWLNKDTTHGVGNTSPIAYNSALYDTLTKLKRCT